MGETAHNVVHIVDDDQRFRDALGMLVAAKGFAPREYLSAEHFLCTYEPAQGECLLLDIRMPGMSGLELLEELASQRVLPPIIVLSAFAEAPSVVAAMRHGAIDFLEKPVEEAVLITKLATALAGDRERKVHQTDLRLRMRRLTSRERDVMELLLAAKNTVQIAHQLEISPKTVERHRVKVFTKLQVDSVPALMRLIADDSPPTEL